MNQLKELIEKEKEILRKEIYIKDSEKQNFESLQDFEQQKIGKAANNLFLDEIYEVRSINHILKLSRDGFHHFRVDEEVNIYRNSNLVSLRNNPM